VLPGTAAFGEIGLTGRLREATQADRRLEECTKLGLGRVVAPAGTPELGASAAKPPTPGRKTGSPSATPGRGKLTVVRAETLRQAIKAALDAAERAEGDDEAAA